MSSSPFLPDSPKEQDSGMPQAYQDLLAEMHTHTQDLPLEKLPAPHTLAKAYETYLTKDASLADIALDLSISCSVLTQLAEHGGWIERKRKVTEVLMQDAELRYRDFLANNKVQTVQSHLSTARQLEEEIKKVIDRHQTEGEDISTLELKRLAESLATATAISARSVGVAEKLVHESGPYKPSLSDPVDKPPLVYIDNRGQSGPTVPDPMNAEEDLPVIDIEPEGA